MSQTAAQPVLQASPVSKGLDCAQRTLCELREFKERGRRTGKGWGLRRWRREGAGRCRWGEMGRGGGARLVARVGVERRGPGRGGARWREMVGRGRLGEARRVQERQVCQGADDASTQAGSAPSSGNAPCLGNASSVPRRVRPYSRPTGQPTHTPGARLQPKDLSTFFRGRLSKWRPRKAGLLRQTDRGVII